MPKHPRGQRRGDQRWSTFVFVSNHAKAIVACDFLTVVTATLKTLYVLVIIEIDTRKLLHINVTDHPAANWTRQQLREAIPADHPYKYLIHDRDCIFSADLDKSIRKLGLRALKGPYRSPLANSFCERVIGTLRRECLDFLIPLTENHLRNILRKWVKHYNQGRPHSSIGPGIPDPPTGFPIPSREHRHRIPSHLKVVASPILGGLHHEYRLDLRAA